MIQESELSQRRIEEQAGFSRGYLSRLLARNVDLKVWHVLAILEILGSNPGEFFQALYPARRQGALSAFAAASQPLSDEMDEVIERLYDLGVESLSALRGRLARCERAVAELESMGVLARRPEPNKG